MRRLAAIVFLPLALAAFAPQPPDNETPRKMSAAEERELSRDTMKAITSQIIGKGCWTDHTDLPEARRLSTTLRIYVGPDGHLIGTPQLIQPASEPLRDHPLQEFIKLAREALKKCDADGFDLPQGASEVLDDEYIDIMFLPKIGVDR